MAVGGRLPVMQAVRMAYRDVYRAYSAMPALLLVALGVAVGFGLLLAQATPVLRIPVLGALLSLLIGAVQSFFLTPVLIAIHRFILIEEVRPFYYVAYQTVRFQRFFAWSVALLALTSSASLIGELLALVGLASWVTGVIHVVLFLVTLFISLRLTILFPAIAVDARGADPAKAFADTKGHAFGIFLISLVAFLPLLAIAIVVIVATVVTSGSAADAPPSAAVTITTQVLFGLIGMPLFVAIASRIFQALADQVLVVTAAEPD